MTDSNSHNANHEIWTACEVCGHEYDLKQGGCDNPACNVNNQ